MRRRCRRRTVEGYRVWTMERWCTYIYSARIDFAIQNALALTTLIDREHNGVSGNELFPRSVVDARGTRKGRRGQGTSSIPFLSMRSSSESRPPPFTVVVSPYHTRPSHPRGLWRGVGDGGAPCATWSTRPLDRTSSTHLERVSLHDPFSPTGESFFLDREPR